MKINIELHQLIIDTINSGICGDVAEKMNPFDADCERHVYTKTNAYDVTQTVIFIQAQIDWYNRMSLLHRKA